MKFLKIKKTEKLASIKFQNAWKHFSQNEQFCFIEIKPSKPLNIKSTTIYPFFFFRSNPNQSPYLSRPNYWEAQLPFSSQITKLNPKSLQAQLLHFQKICSPSSSAFSCYFILFSFVLDFSFVFWFIYIHFWIYGCFIFLLVIFFTLLIGTIYKHHLLI